MFFSTFSQYIQGNYFIPNPLQFLSKQYNIFILEVANKNKQLGSFYPFYCIYGV